eukprot:s871_g18.t1
MTWHPLDHLDLKYPKTINVLDVPGAVQSFERVEPYEDGKATNDNGLGGAFDYDVEVEAGFYNPWPMAQGGVRVEALGCFDPSNCGGRGTSPQAYQDSCDSFGTGTRKLHGGSRSSEHQTAWQDQGPVETIRGQLGTAGAYGLGLSTAAPGPFSREAEDSGVDLLLWVIAITYGVGLGCGWILRSCWYHWGTPDPQDELNAMTTLEHVADWAGLGADLRQALIRDLGTPTKLRDIVFITRPVWDAAITLLKVPVPPATDGAAPTERELSPVEKSRIEIFRRVVMLRVQQTPDTPGDPGVARPGVITTPAQGTSSSAQGSPTRKIKLSVVVDPTLDSEVIQLEQTSVTAMYTKYKSRFGDHPSPEVEPSIDQLSALAQLIKANAVPYVDMSLWGPHALRTLRKAVYVLNASTGEWSKKEAPGPDSLVSWEKSFKTFKVAMVLLEACDPERLEAYLEHVKEFHNRFGAPCWGILYRADTRMRSEYMERIRRSLEDSPKHGYTTADPWAAVFAEAVRDQDFWRREVVTPSTLLLARSRSHAIGLSSDSSVEPAPRSPSKRKRSGSPQPKRTKKKKAKKRYTGDDKSQWDSSAGHYSLNRKGLQICIKFNKAQCGNGKPQSKCPSGGGEAAPFPPAAEAETGKKRKPAGSDKPAAPTEPPQKKRRGKGQEGEEERPEPASSSGIRLVAKADRSPLQRKRRKPSKAAKEATPVAIPKQPTWHEFRYGATNVAPELWDGRPRALLLFSGKPRDGDISSYLSAAGWIVVAVDMIGPIPCNVLEPKIYRAILKDVQDGLYDCAGTVALTSTPKLSAAELKQVKEANQMFDLSADVVKYQLRAHRAFWLENPDHGEKLDFWKTPWGSSIEKHALVDKASFDQCRFDAEVTKPTKLAHFGMDLTEINGVRCNHEAKVWKKEDGSEYTAKHESLVQRWRLTDGGHHERASKALGAYTSKLCSIIAKAMADIDQPRPNKLRKVQLPRSIIAGKAIHKLLLDAADHPEARRLTKALLAGERAEPMDAKFISKLRQLILGVLAPHGTGAPLGYSQPIEGTGVFPRVDGPAWEEEAADALARQLEGWRNHPSAEEWESDMSQLLEEAHSKGFISVFDNMEEAQEYLGRRPILNKVGVIVKIKGDKRKGSYGTCVNLESIGSARRGKESSSLGCWTRHLMPYECSSSLKVLVYDVLVFGAVSSPTIWGRYASWLGRSLAAVNPGVATQIYVDDPIMVHDLCSPEGTKLIGINLLWAAVAGFPIKYEKTEAGAQVKWIGAQLQILPENKEVHITIPADKVSEVVDKINKTMARPVVGKRQLQALAGALSFFAGVVPLMRPFLGAIWAVLATDDGPSRARKLVHTKRIAHAMEWILSLLDETTVPFTRVVRAFKPSSGAIIITDASTWGLGGVLLEGGRPAEFFSCPIPFQFTLKTGAIPGIPKHMALWEALCLLLAARLWLTRFPIGTVVRVKADNISALFLLSKAKQSLPSYKSSQGSLPWTRPRDCMRLLEDPRASPWKEVQLRVATVEVSCLCHSPLLCWMFDRLPFRLPQPFRVMKRSLGPTYWHKPACPVDQPKKPKGLQPLTEGPAISSQAQTALVQSNERRPPQNEEPQVKPYGRGSIEIAVRAAQSGPQDCVEHIVKRSRAANCHGPHKSRERTWETIATAAGFSDPFDLSPNLIFTVMGALDKAGYRSAELYLEVAKQQHISRGDPWSAQLALAARLAKRACQRGRGPAKQAQPLPLEVVATLEHKREPLAPGGPEFPVRATLLASWWLLREIEASNAKLDHFRSRSQPAPRQVETAVKQSRLARPRGNSHAYLCLLGAHRCVIVPFPPHDESDQMGEIASAPILIHH